MREGRVSGKNERRAQLRVGVGQVTAPPITESVVFLILPKNFPFFSEELLKEKKKNPYNNWRARQPDKSGLHFKYAYSITEVFFGDFFFVLL